MSAHLPHPGQEPSRLATKQHIKKKLLAGEQIDAPISYDGDVGNLTEDIAQEHNYIPVGSEPVTVKRPVNTLEVLSDMLKLAGASETVEVKGPFGRISFKALHVSINDYGLAFIVNKDHMSYEPNVNTTLSIRHADKDYNVVYAGGYFTFRHIPLSFLSFIRITEED